MAISIRSHDTGLLLPAHNNYNHNTNNTYINNYNHSSNLRLVLIMHTLVRYMRSKSCPFRQSCFQRLTHWLIALIGISARGGGHWHGKVLHVSCMQSLPD